MVFILCEHTTTYLKEDYFLATYLKTYLKTFSLKYSLLNIK